MKEELVKVAYRYLLQEASYITPQNQTFKRTCVAFLRSVFPISRKENEKFLLFENFRLIPRNQRKDEKTSYY